MDNRLTRLEALNKTLVPPDFLGGVFLPPDSPKKFRDVMFLAEMPSMNVPIGWVKGQPNFNFNVTSRDRFLQEMMSKYGVAGRYATDIVKKRAAPRTPTRSEVEYWLPFLRKEIEIIQPQALVVIGRRTYDQSFMPFVAQHISKKHQS